MTGDEAALAAARQRLLDAMGAEALVDTAAVVGNFERMTRIADGTGIPLDAPMNALAADLQEELRLREFRSAQSTSRPGFLAVTASKLLRPLAFKLMPTIAKRLRARARA